MSLEPLPQRFRLDIAQIIEIEFRAPHLERTHHGLSAGWSRTTAVRTLWPQRADAVGAADDLRSGARAYDEVLPIDSKTQKANTFRRIAGLGFQTNLATVDDAYRMASLGWPSTAVVRKPLDPVPVADQVAVGPHLWTDDPDCAAPRVGRRSTLPGFGIQPDRPNRDRADTLQCPAIGASAIMLYVRETPEFRQQRPDPGCRQPRKCRHRRRRQNR